MEIPLRLDADVKSNHKLRKGPNHEKTNVAQLPYAVGSDRRSAGNARSSE